VAPPLRRLQRLLRPGGQHGAPGRDHAHDLGAVLRRLRARPRPGHGRGGKLLGLAHFLFHRSTTAVGPNCCLQDLFTIGEARGKGVGRALIEAVYERARAAGSPRVYWQTQEGNRAARRLYDKVAENFGFVVYRKLL
jgi:GNAT superfamily N-acetyltransferase